MTAPNPHTGTRFNLAQMEAARGPAAESVQDRGWNVQAGDLDFPMMVLKESAVSHNIRLMSDYCRAHDVELSPHGKTTMMPWLIEQQLAAGAWGMTAATPAQCKVYRQFGVAKILLANELVDPQAIRWVAGELEDPDFEFLCYVDSADSVEILNSTLKGAGSGRPLGVLVELGYPGGRTGARSIEQAREVARLAARSPRLELRGASGFEGFLRDEKSPDVSDACRRYLQDVQHLTVALHSAGLVQSTPMIVSCGGSAYFDAVVQALGPSEFAFPVRTILRAGCYVSHDAEMYETTSPLAGRSTGSDQERLESALELWATVWSRPEPNLAIVGFGRRDAPYDYRLPVPTGVCSRTNRSIRPVHGQLAVTSLNDQHAFVQVAPEDPLAVGDQVLFGVSHPCGAFDSWPWMAVVNDAYDVVRGARTYF